MWQSHWPPRRIPLSHKDLRCVEYFANPGKVGKELEGERTRTVRFQNGHLTKCWQRGNDHFIWHRDQSGQEMYVSRSFPSGRADTSSCLLGRRVAQLATDLF